MYMNRNEQTKRLTKLNEKKRNKWNKKRNKEKKRNKAKINSKNKISIIPERKKRYAETLTEEKVGRWL